MFKSNYQTIDAADTRFPYNSTNTSRDTLQTNVYTNKRLWSSSYQDSPTAWVEARPQQNISWGNVWKMTTSSEVCSFVGDLILSLHLSRMTGSSYSHLLHSLYVKYYGVENVVRVSKWCRNENAHVMCSLTSSGQVGYHLRRTPSFEYRSLEGVKNMLDSRQNVPPSQTQAASADTIIKKRRALYCFGRCDLIYTLGRHWKHSPCCSGGLHTR